FNESIDQALAESVDSYSANLANSRDMFLAILGHDLRSPLASLNGCLELLDTPGVRPAHREQALCIAKRSVASVNSMVIDLLEYTCTRLGQGIKVEPRPGDLGLLCRSAVDEIKAAYPRRSLAAEVLGELRGSFDAARLRQVLINLLSNALQHGDPESPVVLTARSLGERLTIEVRNHGTPIPPEAMQVIFDPLVQIPAMASTTPERPGSSLGLGLFIAREIVMAHGGKISVSSSHAEGTTFVVELPHEARARPPREGAQGSPSPVGV
ncbi:MAG: sensor histidine kinase, partial [Rhizobacter sp.]